MNRSTTAIVLVGIVLLLPSSALCQFTFEPAAGPLPAGTYGTAYNEIIAVTSGGVAPYTYAVTAGAFPAGLSLGPDGVLSGRPMKSTPRTSPSTRTWWRFRQARTARWIRSAPR